MDPDLIHHLLITHLLETAEEYQIQKEASHDPMEQLRDDMVARR
jgi:hypothetical protein